MRTPRELPIETNVVFMGARWIHCNYLSRFLFPLRLVTSSHGNGSLDSGLAEEFADNSWPSVYEARVNLHEAGTCVQFGFEIIGCEDAAAPN